MTDELLDDIKADVADGWKLTAYQARIIADAKIIKAADELAQSLSGKTVYMSHVYTKAEAFRAAMEARG
jgi:hypothetical protein